MDSNDEPNLVPEGYYEGVIVSSMLAASMRSGHSYYRTKVKLDGVEHELFMTIAGIYIRYVLVKLGLPETNDSAFENVGKLVGCRVKVKVKIDKLVEDPSCLFNRVQLMELLV